MKPVEWRIAARRDAADAAWWYARQGGLSLGERFLAQVDEALDRIGRFPGSGSTRHAWAMPDTQAPLRFTLPDGFERYLIYYIELPDHVEVIRICDASRGLDALLGDSE